jgi:XTP/dITP diphosphohydrolase
MMPNPARPWILASHNPGKVREFAARFAELGIDLESAAAAGLNDAPPETGATYADNALIKARYAASGTGRVAISDDSGIEVDALSGGPGVRSARFGDPKLDDRGRMLHLLDVMQGVPDESRGARYVAVVAISTPAGAEATFAGSCSGRILRWPEGEGGFGYDPIFFSDDLQQSFGSATNLDKARVSHRMRALEQLFAFLRSPAAVAFER